MQSLQKSVCREGVLELPALFVALEQQHEGDVRAAGSDPLEGGGLAQSGAAQPPQPHHLPQGQRRQQVHQHQTAQSLETSVVHVSRSWALCYSKF